MGRLLLEPVRAEAKSTSNHGPGPAWRVQLSSEGGTDPLFSRDGREIFYRNGDKMMVVPVSSSQAGSSPARPVCCGKATTPTA